MLTDFKTPKKFKTLQGQEIKVDGLMWHINKKVKVNDAKTVQTDSKATNGVIHAIDSVLMPKYTTLTKGLKQNFPSFILLFLEVCQHNGKCEPQVSLKFSGMYYLS